MSESAKSLRVERIKPEAAKRWLEKFHPLGSGRGITIALGVFWKDILAGVVTLGPPISNHSGTSLGLRQHELIEVHKMHLSDACPRNSESRTLAVVAMLIRKNWPKLRAAITYCGSDEKAAAYKASGWIQGKSNRYVRNVKVGEKWLTIRDANRYGLTSQAIDKKYESRTKWILPLDPAIAELAQEQSAGRPARIRRCDSDRSASVQQPELSDNPIRDVK